MALPDGRLTDVAAPVRDPEGAYPPRVRHLSGPLAPPWYVRHQRAVSLVVMVPLVVALLPFKLQFNDEASFSWTQPRRWSTSLVEGTSPVFLLAGAVFVLRRPVVRAVRTRVWVLDDLHLAGGWRAAGVTAALNALYVLVVVGPGRWVVATAYGAYATGSDRFRAPDAVVAEAVARYVDRTTGLLLLAMAVEGTVVLLAGRGRRRLGLRD